MVLNWVKGIFLKNGSRTQLLNSFAFFRSPPAAWNLLKSVTMFPTVLQPTELGGLFSSSEVTKHHKQRFPVVLLFSTWRVMTSE